jgi:hypothetical protein
MAQGELHAEREAADLRPQLAPPAARRLDLADLAEDAGGIAGIVSSQGMVDVMPLVSMNTPRSASPRAPVSASISASSASREGMGMPASPLCCSAVEVAKPMAPARTASSTIRFISAISAGVAARLVASAPRT